MAKAKDRSCPKNANYDGKQNMPATPMGSGSFANLPNKPMYADFAAPTYRDGIINNFTCSVNELSEVGENEKD
jgi:hypothetical protein